MSADLYAVIASLAGNLIAGRKVCSLYDFATAQEIDPSILPDIAYLRPYRQFRHEAERAPAPTSQYQYPLGDGRSLDISVLGNSFLVNITGQSMHFMGTVRGNTISLYDHQTATHFNYRIAVSEQDQGGY